MANGFLGRWSQRKQAIKQGRDLDDPAEVEPKTVNVQAGVSSHTAVGPVSEVTSDGPQSAAIQATPPTARPAPTLADVDALNADASFAPFVARDVSPEVRNAAMKKLFTDPHYNLMDGLDIYIDDYSKPDPMPAAMLRQLASAKFLNLFDEEEAATVGSSATQLAPRTDVNPVTVVSDGVGESAAVLSDTPGAVIPDSPTDILPAPSAACLPAQEPHHDHTDLRLQPNDAAGRPQSERVPE